MPRLITTERLHLRPLTAADGDAVVAILNDFEVSRWLVPIPHPFTHADLRITNPDGSSRWPDLAAITRDGKLLGGIAIGARLGYYLAPNAWGQGITSEAVSAAVRYSFETLQVPRIEAGYFEGNQASERILAKHGFRETGRGPENCAAQGRALPSVSVALTRAHWEARHV